jgi:hypothetical protein
MPRLLRHRLEPVPRRTASPLALEQRRPAVAGQRCQCQIATHGWAPRARAEQSMADVYPPYARALALARKAGQPLALIDPWVLPVPGRGSTAVGGKSLVGLPAFIFWGRPLGCVMCHADNMASFGQAWRDCGKEVIGQRAVGLRHEYEPGAASGARRSCWRHGTLPGAWWRRTARQCALLLEARPPLKREAAQSLYVFDVRLKAPGGYPEPRRPRQLTP